MPTKNQLIAKIKRLEKLTVIDPLTGLYNYRYFKKAFSKELARAKRYKRFLSLLVVDINDLKKINDKMGHSIGDKTLKKLSKILVKNIREADIVCRYGGDEFVIILPECNKDHALVVAMGIREDIEKKIKLTLSIGVATYPNDGDCFNSLFEQADRAMYRKKRKLKKEVKNVKMGKSNRRYNI